MAKKSSKIDWENFDKTVKKASQRAADKTDDELSVKLAAISSLTQREVEALFPEPSDMEKLSELMQVIKSSTSRHKKINAIVDNSEKFAGIIVDLLGKFF